MNVQPEFRFMVDHMLIKLGKYLRILGYDAEWDTYLRTHELILVANSENRVFLTRNTKLGDQYPFVRKVLVISSTDPQQQLKQVILQTGINPQCHLFSRCVRCNVVLYNVLDKKEIEGCVHPHVYLRHEHFFKCPLCDTIFWRGSHVVNTCTKLGLKMPGSASM
ncbi:MAG: hypothetical protein A2283_10285 [Lentisphaerae bacterium RIFOXYA12_FULL_48_11]|nr:MAG: hypothetical protein A2283_10285 [Lentisphaerae bacterium RIFOXYA12_FULL_48_11]